MKVGKHYLGKEVRLTWADPNYGKVDLHALKKGRPALATWTERGVVHDITDGIVIILHSYGMDGAAPDERLDEVSFTALPEDVIESIVVLIPEPETKG